MIAAGQLHAGYGMHSFDIYHTQMVLGWKAAADGGEGAEHFAGRNQPKPPQNVEEPDSECLALIQLASIQLWLRANEIPP